MENAHSAAPNLANRPAASYRPAVVAELLGVSTDTIRRWCDDGRLTWTPTEPGRSKLVDGASLARHLSEQATAYQPETMTPTSARNRFTGIVTRVERDGLVALVEVHAHPHRLVSMMTREAVDELGLKPGDLATAAVKSTNVVIEVPTP